MINLSSFYFTNKPFQYYRYSSFIVYGITSRCDSFSRRITLRKTMEMRMRLYESRLFFFVGKSHDSFHNSLIKTEEAIFNDIIQISFYESYYNLSILSLWMIKWVVENCRFKFFIKNDQDVIPNLKLIYQWLIVRRHSICSYGFISRNETTCRNKKMREYIPFFSYNKSTLPTYIFGYFAIYSYASLKEIDKISFSIYPIIYKEDVFIGLLFYLTNNSFCEIDYNITDIRYCNISKLNKVERERIIAVHGVNYNYHHYFFILN